MHINETRTHAQTTHDLQETRDGEPIAQAESQQDRWWNRGGGGGWHMTPAALGLHPQPHHQKDLDS